MPPKSIGQCKLCHEHFSQKTMLVHLTQCRAEHATDSSSKESVVLRIESPGTKKYWLLVECDGSASFKKLDTLLRDVWLECCGHMSGFFTNKKEISKTLAVASILSSKGDRIHYEYDFGSTTYLSLQVVAVGDSCVRDGEIRLLARNDWVQWNCSNCKELASQLCTSCIYEYDAFFCDDCAAEHDCGEEMLLPVVNSPRMGVCGYTG